MQDAWFRFGESHEESMKLADDAAHKALESAYRSAAKGRAEVI
jgi:hypothetical protein